MIVEKIRYLGNEFHRVGLFGDDKDLIAVLHIDEAALLLGIKDLHARLKKAKGTRVGEIKVACVVDNKYGSEKAADEIKRLRDELGLCQDGNQDGMEKARGL